jgi:hypothetical protein
MQQQHYATWPMQLAAAVVLPSPSGVQCEQWSGDIMPSPGKHGEGVGCATS